MGTPFFSVIIPLYNKGKYIERTINSVLKQTFGDYEVIVVDDGSTDDGPEKVAAFNDPRIRLIRQGNCGVSSARNRAINESHGRYVAFLDADDYWYECHLKYAREFFTSNSNVRWYSSGWTHYSPETPMPQSCAQKPLYSIESYLEKAYRSVWTSSVVIEADLVMSVGGFSPKYSFGEDLHLWYRIARIEEFLGVTNTVTALYINTEYSLTKSTLVTASDFVLDFLEPQRQYEPPDPALCYFVKCRIYNYFLASDTGRLLNFLNTYPGAINILQRCAFRAIAVLPLWGQGRILAFRVLNRLRII